MLKEGYKQNLVISKKLTSGFLILFLAYIIKIKTIIFYKLLLKEMLEVSPVGVETKLCSLHDVGCHSSND